VGENVMMLRDPAAARQLPPEIGIAHRRQPGEERINQGNGGEHTEQASLETPTISRNDRSLLNRIGGTGKRLKRRGHSQMCRCEQEDDETGSIPERAPPGRRVPIGQSPVRLVADLDLSISETIEKGRAR